jgi:hypothetical protein
MSYFIRERNSYSVATKNSFLYEDLLPPGTYVVKFDSNRGQYILQIVDDFDISHKLYGNTVSNADRIIRTFRDRNTSTGVMLSGNKGSGKTLLAKVISKMLRDSGVPTVIINEPHCGDTFNAFVQSIAQECMIIFDEFEKVYSNKREQEAILTLLDGVYPSKKLFVLTLNEQSRIDTNLKNRPGRIFYMLDFSGLEVDFIREYCQENLINKDQIESICRVSRVFDSFNFDMLKAMVEEMNRYGETVNQVMKFINTKVESMEPTEYEVSILNFEKTPERISLLEFNDTNPDEVFSSEMSTTSRVYVNPVSLTGGETIEISVEFGKERFYTEFTESDLIDIDVKNSSFKFKNEYGDILLLTRTKKKTFSYAF